MIPFVYCDEIIVTNIKTTNKKPHTVIQLFQTKMGFTVIRLISRQQVQYRVVEDEFLHKGSL